jgi:RNA polymerase sigma factor for flagellar operon FliA
MKSRLHYKKAYETVCIDNEQERNQLILDHLPMIKFIATRIANRLPPNVQVEDLIEAGIIGLLDAIEKFDASKEVKFKTYAEFRIRGAILDELRAQDWTPRSVHQKVKRVERAYIDVEQRTGRTATDEEIANEMNIPLDKYHKLINQIRNVSIVSLEDLTKVLPMDERENILDCLKSPQDESIYERVNLKQIKDLLSEAINELHPKDQMILSLYYWDELTMKEIGSIMGLAESTISERHTKAMIILKQKLREVMY